MEILCNSDCLQVSQSIFPAWDIPREFLCNRHSVTTSSQESKDHGQIQALPMPQSLGAASQLQLSHLVPKTSESHRETPSKTKGERALTKISLSPKALRATELQTRKHCTPAAPCPGTAAKHGSISGRVSTSARASPALLHPAPQ